MYITVYLILCNCASDSCCLSRNHPVWYIYQCPVFSLYNRYNRNCYIMPVLWQLRQSLVKQHVEYKLTVLTYKAVRGFLPPYLARECQLVTTTGRHQLRSSDIPTLVIQCMSTRFGDKCFLCAAAWSQIDFHCRWGF